MKEGGRKERTLALPPEYHPTDYFTPAQTTSHNLDDPTNTKIKRVSFHPHTKERQEERIEESP
jgi:hypothetical protein